MLGKKGKIWTNKLGILQKTDGTKKWIPLQPKEEAGFPGTGTLLRCDPHQTSNLMRLRILCCSKVVDLL